MKNLLKTIIIGTAIGLTSCSPSPYDYKGKIGNESITTIDNPSFNYFDLYVTKEDGRVIDYWDNNRDGTLDFIRIRQNGKVISYREYDKVGKEAFKIAKQQYTDYLAKILEIKKKKAIENVK